MQLKPVLVSDCLQASPVLVKYFGWYQGATPHPTQSPGYIIMSSNLVEYDSAVPA